MRLIDADELIEHVWRDRLDSRERIADLVKSMPSAEPQYTEQDMRDQFNAGYACGMEAAQPDSKYEYHYDHTDCIWYRPEARNRCPTTCAQYRDGWNDAMNYIFRDGKGYRPYRRDKQYGE